MSKQSTFNSKLGVILAAAGSAVGLGNIWKFPYMVGENGGGAFLIIYVLCCIFIGLPLVITEFSIGKRAGTGLAHAFQNLSGNSRWQWIGVQGAVTAFLLLSFYTVVTGWCFEYLWQSIADTFQDSNISDLEQHFVAFTGSTFRPVFWSIVALISTAVVSWMGVQSGIERISKLLMPLLLIILMLLIGHAFMMPGCDQGMRFLFKPDFSKLSPQVLLNAMGQCFFSLSIAMGILITYGSYMPKGQDIVGTSLQVTILDTVVAILAGIAIFPAVFAMGVEPTEGPRLVFVILPTVFNQMALGQFWAILFFLLITLAAVTSLLALLEGTISYVTEKWNIKRNYAIGIILVLLIIMLTLCSLSLTGSVQWLQPFNISLFDLFDFVTSKILMPIGALGILIYVGWFTPRDVTEDELRKHSKLQIKVLYHVYFFLIRFLLPIVILLIFLNGLGVF